MLHYVRCVAPFKEQQTKPRWHFFSTLFLVFRCLITYFFSAEDNPYEARPCPVCHKLISNRANLKKHLKIRHSAQEEALCLYCRKVFRNKYSLWTHINSYHPGVKAANPNVSTNAPDAAAAAAVVTFSGASGSLSNFTTSSSSSGSGSGYAG